MRTRMMLTVTSVLAALILLGIAFSCAQPAPTSAPAPTPAATTKVAPTSAPAPTSTAAAYKPPALVSIGTPAMGGASYSALLAAVPLMEKSVGIPVRLVPQPGVPDVLKYEKQGQTLMSFGFNVQAQYEAYVGDFGFANEDWGPQNLRIVWNGYDWYCGLLVRGDSSIKTLTAADFKGKKYGDWSGSGSREPLAQGLINWIGLQRSDLQNVVVASSDGASKAITEGRTDWTWLGVETTYAVQAETAPQGIRWINMPLADKAGWQKFNEKCPFGIPGTVRRGVKSGIGIETVILPSPMFSLASTDQEVTYRIAKFFGESYQDYKGLFPALEDFSLEKMKTFVDNTPYPIAEGTIRYLKEKNVWTAQNDTRNKQLLTLIDKYRAAWDAAIKDAKAKGIKVEYTNAQWISLWESYRKPLPAFGTK